MIQSFGSIGSDSRLSAQLQHVEMSIVAKKWADYSVRDVEDNNTLCGGIVIEIRWFEYEACLAVVRGKACLTAPINKYDTQTLWRVETSFLVGPPGSLLEQDSVVRLRHLTEGTYLCRDLDSGDVTQTLDSEHAGAQWQFDILGYYKDMPLRDSKVHCELHLINS